MAAVTAAAASSEWTITPNDFGSKIALGAGLLTPPALGAGLVTPPLRSTEGLPSVQSTTMRNTVFQLKTDDAYRGRTMSVLLVASRGGTQASHLETGLAVSAGGPGFAPLLGAAVNGASQLAVNLRTADVRHFRGLPDPAAAAALPGPDADAIS